MKDFKGKVAVVTGGEEVTGKTRMVRGRRVGKDKKE